MNKLLNTEHKLATALVDKMCEHDDDPYFSLGEYVVNRHVWPPTEEGYEIASDLVDKFLMQHDTLLMEILHASAMEVIKLKKPKGRFNPKWAARFLKNADSSKKKYNIMRRIKDYACTNAFCHLLDKEAA